MWARVKLKIGWSDLAYTLYSAMRGGDRNQLLENLEHYWSPKGDALNCFSVRGGFDLLLQAMFAEGRIQEGDEIMFSALNVKQMVRAVERLNLVPVPVDLDLSDMSPSIEAAERAVNSRSKVFVVAHLFGARVDIKPAFEFAQRHGLLLVEDCAQAYDGQTNRGTAFADVAMFSFGPIKTKTCLGGAMLNIKDDKLRERMREIRSSYGVQTNADHAKRAIAFAGLKIVTTRPMFWLLDRAFRLRGRSFDEGVSNAVRDVAKQKTPKQLRRQCSTALLRLMLRRLQQDVSQELNERTRLGQKLRSLIDLQSVLPAAKSNYHDYWVFPAIVENPQDTISALRLAGFDACDLPRSEAIKPPSGRDNLRAVVAEAALEKLIVLPCYPEMPDKALEVEAAAFNRVAKVARLPEPLTKSSAA
mgnify:CR=1 FL=1